MPGKGFLRRDDGGLFPTELSRHRLRSGIFFGVALLASAAVIGGLFSLRKEPPSTERYIAVGDFPPGHVWFNTTRPLSLYGNLQGHVLVILFCDFARLSDISSLERLRGLRDSMPAEPVSFIVAYVPLCDSLEVWRQTVRDWDVGFPVIVDDDGEVRENFAIDSIPQMLLLDTHSRVISRYGVDWQNADVGGLIRDLLAQGMASRSLATEPFRPDPGEFVPPGREGPR